MTKKMFLVLMASAASTLLFAESSNRSTDNSQSSILNSQFVSDSLALEEVVVTGTRNATDVRHLPMTVTVIDRDLLTAEHQTNVLPTVMREVPGLFVTSRSMLGYGVSGGAAGGINLRGISGGAGQLLVLIDGHPQYQGIYGHPIADSYQTMIAERVEVLRGPASMLYGSNAMGGVLNIVTRQAMVNGQRSTVNVGAGSYGTVQAEASNQVRSGKFYSTVAGQYQRSDNHRPRMGFEQYGGYLHLGYDISDHWNAYIDGNLTRFNASYPGAETSPLYNADQWITRGVVSAALENHYGRTSGALSVYSNFGRHKIDDGTADPAKPTARFFRSKDALTGVSWWQHINLPLLGRGLGGGLTLGVDYMHIYGNAYYTSKATGEILDTPNKQSGRSYRNEIAGYVDFRQDLLEWLTVDAGVRLDHHSITGTEWVPQAGIVVRPIASGEIKAMASKGFRNPTMREMYLYPPSNTDLEPERLWNYELSWHHRLGGGFTYGANIYYIKGDNMIQTMPVDGKPRNVNTGEIENWGFELEAKYPIGPHFSVRANTSYLHMKNKIIAAPVSASYLGMDYRQGKWYASFGLQYINHLYTSVGDNETTENFFLLNASVTYAATKALSLWARGENLLAQKYEINLGYPMPRATFMGGLSLNF
ncbi:MAG: TonB-dependent receptor [Prevotella sp.]|nr:TonB-dependent receptor [Prevotella sp.]